MPEKTRVDENLGIIEMQFSDVVSKEDIIKSIDKVLGLLDTRKYHKILVDTIDQKNVPSPFGIFNRFSLSPQEFTLALVVRKSKKIEGEISFLETVGNNAFFQVKIFPDKDQALQWLKTDAESTN